MSLEVLIGFCKMNSKCKNHDFVYGGCLIGVQQIKVSCKNHDSRKRPIAVLQIANKTTFIDLVVDKDTSLGNKGYFVIKTMQ